MRTGSLGKTGKKLFLLTLSLSLSHVHCLSMLIRRDGLIWGKAEGGRKKSILGAIWPSWKTLAKSTLESTTRRPASHGRWRWPRPPSEGPVCPGNSRRVLPRAHKHHRHGGWQMGTRARGERKNRWHIPMVSGLFLLPEEHRGQTSSSSSDREDAPLLRRLGKGVEVNLPTLLMVKHRPGPNCFHSERDRQEQTSPGPMKKTFAKGRWRGQTRRFLTGIGWKHVNSFVFSNRTKKQKNNKNSLKTNDQITQQTDFIWL